MKIIRGSRNIGGEIKNPVLTLGNFDGVHIGHQAIFEYIVKRSQDRNGTSIVYTFEPHPLKILSPGRCPPMLTVFHKKMELIQRSGVDMVICADFTRQFADQRPRDFAKEILYGKIGVKEVFVGYNYKFGRGKEGTIDYLKKMGREFGFGVNVIDPVKRNGCIVSSTKIRELIGAGDVYNASLMLGRSYSIKGKIVKGFKKGTVIGYPTANIETIHELIPHTGVYAVTVLRRNKEHYRGIANVGFNPTFNRDRLSVEVHIFDLHEDMYDEELDVSFIKRIREEVEFASPERLIEQIKKDIASARDILIKHDMEY